MVQMMLGGSWTAWWRVRLLLVVNFWLHVGQVWGRIMAGAEAAGLDVDVPTGVVVGAWSVIVVLVWGGLVFWVVGL